MTEQEKEIEKFEDQFYDEIGQVMRSYLYRGLPLDSIEAVLDDLKRDARMITREK